MNNRWVVNASPLILLAKVNQLDLLGKLTDQLVIPKAVKSEISRGPSIDPARQWIENEGSKFVVDDPEPAELVMAFDLGRGETEVLTWAYLHEGFEAILDDGAARRAAMALKAPFRGTIGVILAARKRDLIVAARPVCNQLIEAGLQIDPTIVNQALRLVDE